MVEQKSQVSDHARVNVPISTATPDIEGDYHPKDLLRAIPEEHDFLAPLAGQSIISSDQFDVGTLLQIFRLAAKYECNPNRFTSPLTGKLLISAFYEPSTRTRLSFESAWHRLGGDIMSITDRSTTGIAKGESLFDVGQMFNNYADCVVLRDNSAESVREMERALKIPIINAGNGVDEHPTQAMADIYTILKWKPGLITGDAGPIKIAIIGVPSMMRSVRSLLITLSKFSNAFEEVLIIHDDSENEVWSEGQKELLEARGLNIRETTSLDKFLPDMDVVYINTIAWVDDDYEVKGERLRLNKNSPLKQDAIVMHPLARGSELDEDLDNTPHNWYFAQARGALFIRMALLTCTVQRAHQVMDVV